MPKRNTAMIVELSPGIASWAYEDTTLAGGTSHNIDADPRLANAIAGAAAAGTLRIIEGDVPADAVESDEDSLKKQDVAMRARTELIGDRDRALAAVAQDVLNDEPDLAPEDRVQRMAQVRQERIEEWEQKMNEAAQKAVEEAF